jgi:undecaprenyl-diphosphatase
MVMCALLIGALIGEVGLKHLVCRPRPFIVNPDVIPPITPPSGYSFPSGHSCSSFVAVTIMFVRDKRIGIPALVLGILIAFSRLYNYVHFPSDVLCGILLGIISAIIVLVIFKKTGFDKKLSGDLKYKSTEN